PAGRLAVDELAETVEEGRLAGGDADGGKLFFQAEAGQDLRRVRQHVDPDADRPQPRGGLVDLAVDAGGVRLQGGRQPRAAPPDDRDLHRADSLTAQGPSATPSHTLARS